MLDKTKCLVNIGKWGGGDIVDKTKSSVSISRGKHSGLKKVLNQ